MKNKLLLLLLFAFFAIGNIVAQVNGTAVTPTVSTTASPVWYYIESAADGSKTNYDAPQDLRGNVLIAPSTAGKLKWGLLTSTALDNALWAIVNDGAGNKLYNKASQHFYMSVSFDAAAVGDAFIFTNYASTSQYKISSGGQNPTLAHNLNLCNRNSDLGVNSKTAWYFIQTTALDPTDVLTPAIASAELVLVKSPAGTNPGTYTTAARNTFRTAINVAIAVKNSTADNAAKELAVTVLSQAKTDFLATRNQIKVSTEGDDTWYYIVLANTTYATGQVIVNQNNIAGTSILFTAKSLDPNKLWKFVNAGNGKVSIQNRASGLYISADPKTSGSSSTAVPFAATFLGEGAQFTFNADGKNPIHAQQNGSVLVTWAGGLNTASAWKLEELPAADNNLEVSISSSSIKQRYTETAIGNRDHTLAYVTLSTSGLVGEVLIKSFTVNFSGTNNINAIESIKIYATGNDTKLDTKRHTLIATLQQPTSAAQSTVIEFSESFRVGLGSSNFHFVADVSENAIEGDKLNIRLLSVAYSNNGDKEFVPTTKAAPFASTVFLKQSILFTPGDYNSVSYRIPAIVTADNGSLVALTDKRKFNSTDLPEDIDIVARISTDGGSTWGDPINVAVGTGRNKGFGDAVLVKAKSGKLIALFVGGPGLSSSTPSNPIRSYVSTSSDNGLTWTSPRDVTNQLFGSSCPDPIRATWNASFFGSGHGLCTRSGRIMAVAAVSEPGMGGLQNYTFYSDDEGENWNVSKRAIVGGDEAKVVELNNGDILMSSRTGGNRLWAKSTDGGVNWGIKNSWTDIWGNACDADILRYTSTLDGYSKNRLLHTLPNASDRSNLNMWISYDEGTTWLTKKVICPGTSAYSSITILPDGTIGVYYEADGDNPYTMMYVNFSLNWLTNGKDNYDTPTAVETVMNNKLKVYAENGLIKVDDKFTKMAIYNLQGVELNNNSALKKGIYLVLVDNNTYKVHVN